MSSGAGINTTLIGARIVLRPLTANDFEQWRKVRRENSERLKAWEPKRSPGGPDVVEDRAAFAMRCHAREREWQVGGGYGFGIFLGGNFIGEININAVQRGPFQNAYVGYWVDRAHSGRGYTPEALVGRQVVAAVNLGTRRIAGFVSEVLVLGGIPDAGERIGKT